jgi:hypothetical protein
LLETPVAEVYGTSRFLGMPALLGFDLNGEGVPKGVGQVVGCQEHAVWAQDDAMAHDVFLAPLKRSANQTRLFKMNFWKVELTGSFTVNRFFSYQKLFKRLAKLQCPLLRNRPEKSISKNSLAVN